MPHAFVEVPNLLAEPDDIGPELPAVAGELPQLDWLAVDPDSELLVGLASRIGQLAVNVDDVL